MRFTIKNLDSLGTLTDVTISGSAPTPGPLGFDICDLGGEVPPLQTATCVVGPFPTQNGDQALTFAAVGEGFRQGLAAGQYFSPPLPTSLGYAGAPFSFVFAFDNQVLIEGTAHTSTVVVNLPGIKLSRPLAVDCSDSFTGGTSDTGGSPTGGEPKIIAYVVGKFTGGGAGAGSCSQIPKRVLVFTSEIFSDDSVHYSGP